MHAVGDYVYNENDMLGGGAFGTVYKGQSRPTKVGLMRLAYACSYLLSKYLPTNLFRVEFLYALVLQKYLLGKSSVSSPILPLASPTYALPICSVDLMDHQSKLTCNCTASTRDHGYMCLILKHLAIL